MQWTHQHLLCIDQLCTQDILTIFATARHFDEINRRPVKKVPLLKGKSIVLFFAEPSTRTKTSFDVAGKRLGADTFALAKSGSSLQKGESLKDTGLTLQAMHPDAIVIRDSRSGAAEFLAHHLDCSIVNAGDGWHAHPTQALLDGYTLSTLWDSFEDKTVLIVGDITHSRVARSNISLLHTLGAKIRLCAPRTLLPREAGHWPVEIFHDLHTACKGVHAIICLRLQQERQAAGLLPSLDEYSRRYGLDLTHLEHAAPNARILHPGPINRGVEITPRLADAKASLILDQVSSGVSVRMAVLHLLILGREKNISGEAHVH